MSFVIVYSLVLASVLTFSALISSCACCISTCAELGGGDEDEPMPECVSHMYS